MIDIIVDSHRRAKGKPAVGAADKYHFGESIATRLHDCQLYTMSFVAVPE